MNYELQRTVPGSTPYVKSESNNPPDGLMCVKPSHEKVAWFPKPEGFHTLTRRSREQKKVLLILFPQMLCVTSLYTL